MFIGVLRTKKLLFFDECKVGSSISCYFYDNNVANSSDDENGRCIRYALVSGSLIPQFPDPKIILILKMIKSFKQLSMLLNFENQPYGFIFINFYNHQIFYTILLKKNFIKLNFKYHTLKKQTCDTGYTSPCRCPTNMREERCKYKYGMSMTIVSSSIFQSKLTFDKVLKLFI